jgi:hypothetical protein
VPVRVEPAPGEDTGEVTSPTVEVSFDDGETWRRAPVLTGHVFRWHPRGEGFVSLRATATDTAGNTVEQTAIRAYGIR